MRRILSVCGFVLLGLAATVPAGAGDKDKKKETGGAPKVERGPEHKVLETLVGTFDADVTLFPPGGKAVKSKGVLTRKMILGGNYLQESFTGEFFNSKFNGIGIIGYDANKKKFTTVWVDNMSTNMMLMEGTYDAGKKMLANVGDDFEPNEKKKMKARDVLKIVSEDTQTFEMYRLTEGAKDEFKLMEITYTRKKTEKK